MCSSDLCPAGAIPVRQKPRVDCHRNLLRGARGKLDAMEVEGVAGGGLVRIRATAKGRIIGVAIDDSLMDKAEKGILEDLIAAAFNDARAKADQVSNAEMTKMQGGMGLPPGFKLPGM